MRRVAAVSLLLLSACKSDTVRLADELDRASSWLATTVEVLRTTGENRTPKRFARDAIDDALAELSKAESSVSGDGRRLIAESKTRIAACDTAWLSAASDSL